MFTSALLVLLLAITANARDPASPGTVASPTSCSPLPSGSAMTVTWTVGPGQDDLFKSVKAPANRVPTFVWVAQLVSANNTALQSGDVPQGVLLGKSQLHINQTMHSGRHSIDVPSGSWKASPGNYVVAVDFTCTFNLDDLLKIPGCNPPDRCRPCSGLFPKRIVGSTPLTVTAEQATGAASATAGAPIFFK